MTTKINISSDSRYRDFKLSCRRSDFSVSLYIDLFYKEKQGLRCRISDHPLMHKLSGIKSLIVGKSTTEEHVVRFLVNRLEGILKWDYLKKLKSI